MQERNTVGARLSPSIRNAMCGPIYDSVRPWAQRIEAREQWPSVAELDQVFRDRLGWPDPVSLEAQKRTGRRRRPPLVVRDTLYEARIYLERRIPTRERSVHDLANVLIWSAFPRSKRALVARQYAALAADVGVVVDRLPGARSRERDQLTLLDEGGVVLLTANKQDAAAVREGCARHRDEALRQLRAQGRVTPLVFGHALLEHAALGRPLDVGAFGFTLDAEGPLPESVQACVDLADIALARLLASEHALSACPVSLAALAT